MLLSLSSLRIFQGLQPIVPSISVSLFLSIEDESILPKKREPTTKNTPSPIPKTHSQPSSFLTTCNYRTTTTNQILEKQTLTILYHLTQRNINIKKETSASIGVFSIASFISLCSLLLQLHLARASVGGVGGVVERY